MPENEKCRLAIDFPNRESLVEFVDTMRETGLVPYRAAPFVMDGLDQIKGSGVTFSNTFILRSRDDRPEEMELKVKETRTKFTY